MHSTSWGGLAIQAPVNLMEGLDQGSATFLNGGPNNCGNWHNAIIYLVSSSCIDHCCE